MAQYRNEESPYQLCHEQHFHYTFDQREGEKTARTVTYVVQISQQENPSGFTRFSAEFGRLGKNGVFVRHLPLHLHVDIKNANIDDAIFVEEEPVIPPDVFVSMNEWTCGFLREQGRAVWTQKIAEREERDRMAAQKDGKKEPKGQMFARPRRQPMVLTPAARLQLNSNHSRSFSEQLEGVKLASSDDASSASSDDAEEDPSQDPGWEKMAKEREAASAAR